MELLINPTHFFRKLPEQFRYERVKVISEFCPKELGITKVSATHRTHLFYHVQFVELLLVVADE